MIIKKRVVNIENYLINFKENQMFGVGIILDDNSNISVLKKIGFSEKLEIGERVLPKIIGSKSRFNAEGKEVPLKNLPKETFYIEREWKWQQWTSFGTEECSRIVWIPRERYQREHINAPEVELEIKETFDNKKIIISDFIEYSENNYEKIKHIINLFLELFGSCDVFDEEFKTKLLSKKIKKLNWRLLKPGIRSWSTLKEELKSTIDETKKSKKIILEDRLEKINSYSPDFVAIGQAGYSGYVVFGFKDKNKYVLENNSYGNAIYIFDEKWEIISQLTKSEVFYKNLYLERIIHGPTWKEELNKILG